MWLNMGFPDFRTLEYLFLIFLVNIVANYAEEPPGPETLQFSGLKLVVDNAIFSFTTDVCSGGVFFKEPVPLNLECIHGYFLARPNGCSMDGSSIIGGKNYVCRRDNQGAPDLIQAFIPVTNPEHPLDHTVTLYDDPDTLKNFRRYTIDNIDEDKYETSTSEPVGVIIANSQENQKINIEKLCYEGRAQGSRNSYMANLRRTMNSGDSGNKLTTSGCHSDSVSIPWGEESTFNFSQGFSDPALFSTEIMAALPESAQLPEYASQSSRLEIWGGIAYCLQANRNLNSTITPSIKTKGIEPSIESLKLFCPTTSPKMRNRRQIKKKRELPSWIGGSNKGPRRYRRYASPRFPPVGPIFPPPFPPIRPQFRLTGRFPPGGPIFSPFPPLPPIGPPRPIPRYHPRGRPIPPGWWRGRG